MSRLKYTLILVAIFLLGLFTRLYKLDQITPGYLGDEVPIAESADYVMSHPYTPFLGVHPTLPLYFIGFFMKLFGQNLIGIRFSVVLFTAATLPVFFILCRRFFSPTVSVAATLLLNFSYGSILTSRFANEVAPAVFFQVLSYLFLVLAVRKKSLKYLVLLGLSLGLGLHTYLTFRSQAVFITIIALIFYPAKKHFFAFFAAILLTISPLIAYEFAHPGAMWIRVKEISPLHLNLTTSQIIQEFAASSFNIVRGFFIWGDPDPRQNPARAALYDPATVALAILGLIWLFFRRRRLFFIALFLGLPVFVNDAITVEIIPDFRIPGQSHPNTFHLSGFMPLVHLSAAFGLNYLFSLRLHPYLKYSLLGSAIFLIVVYNLNLYFNQTLEPYVYYFHNIRNQQITSVLNNFSGPVHVSPSLIDVRITYFLTSSPVLIPIQSVATPPAFIDLRSQPNIAPPPGTNVSQIINPWGQPEVLVVTQ